MIEADLIAERRSELDDRADPVVVDPKCDEKQRQLPIAANLSECRLRRSAAFSHRALPLLKIVRRRWSYLQREAPFSELFVS